MTAHHSDMFGALRSTLHAPAMDSEDAWKMAHHHWSHNPERFEAELFPYLSKKLSRSYLPHIEVSSRAEYELAHKLFARVGPVTLRLFAEELDEERLSQLRGPWLDEVVSLHVRECALSSRELHTLTSLSDFRALSRLDLAFNVIDHEALTSLLEKDFPSLVALDLSHNQLDPQAMTALHEATFFTRLDELNLSFNPITVRGLNRLVPHGQTCRLTRLAAARCQIELSALGCLTRYRQLTWLDLSRNHYTPPSHSPNDVTFMRHDLPESLHTLHLNHCRLEEYPLNLSRPGLRVISLRDNCFSTASFVRDYMDIGHGTLELIDGRGNDLDPRIRILLEQKRPLKVML